MIIVAGTMTFDPARWDALEAAWDTVRAATLQEEGCLEYDVHRSRHDEGTVILLERWASMTSLNAHLAGPAVAAFGRTLAHIGHVDVGYTVYEATPM